MYGSWTVSREDILEVWCYRVALSLVASTFVACSLLDVPFHDSLSFVGIAGLGVALRLIHMYVAPLKRALQLFWALGALGYGYLALSPESSGYASTLEYIVATPWTIWLVGPLGAAMTGVTIKEGLCYGKKEAFALSILIPALFLCHLSALDSNYPAVGRGLDLAVCVLMGVFAGRKYTQQVVDDIGDNSVFAFQRMSEAEQAQLLEELTRRDMYGSVQDTE
jgi:uncharacterized integral membrane protein